MAVRPSEPPPFLLAPLSSFNAPSLRLARCTLGLLLASCATARLSAGEQPAARDRQFIREYKITGARKLGRKAVEAAVYPFLGPDRTEEDMEFARVALEKAYQEAGYQTVSVLLPAQNVDRGVVELRVVERKVGRLRVKGASYSSIKAIKEAAPSVAEGKVIDFNEVPKDLVALNQSPDRQVTPALREGVEPNTVDVDLEVKERSPLHASLGLNNRQSPNTTPLRLDASVSFNNLAQSGNSLGLSAQTAPQKFDEVKVVSGYFLRHFKGLDWLNLMVQGVKQDSNVSTLGNTAVAGRGSTAGVRLLFNLPGVDHFSQSASLGIDYKHFDQTLTLGGSGTTPGAKSVTPINYVPVSVGYSATFADAKKGTSTELNLAGTFHIRGLGSNEAEYELNRAYAGGNFFFFHGDLSHTRPLVAGIEITGRLQGQLADQPLLSGEQFTGGGLGTARGYLESEQVGDSGVFGSLELRTPALFPSTLGANFEVRTLFFTDLGWLKVIDPLKDQKNHFDFASVGGGAQVRFRDNFNGSVLLGVPLLTQGTSKAGHLRLSFQTSLTY